MALMTNYRPVYGELTEDAMTKVGEFSARFMTAKANDDIVAMKAMIKQAMADVVAGGEDSLDRLFGTLHYVERYGDPQEKEAVAQLMPLLGIAAAELTKEAGLYDSWKGLNSADKWRTGLAAGSFAASVAPLAGYAAGRVGRSVKIKQSLREILQDHPELRSDPNVPRYFQAIVDFAPTVAGNSLVAGNVLMQLHRLGPTSVTPKTIAELLDLQSSVNRQPSLSEKIKDLDFGTALKGLPGKPKKD